MDIMLFQDNKVLITLAEALKAKTPVFSNPMEAVRYVEDNRRKAVMVDSKLNAYYEASQLGVEFEAPMDEQPKEKKTANKK